MHISPHAHELQCGRTCMCVVAPSLTGCRLRHGRRELPAAAPRRHCTTDASWQLMLCRSQNHFSAATMGGRDCCHSAGECMVHLQRAAQQGQSQEGRAGRKAPATAADWAQAHVEQGGCGGCSAAPGSAASPGPPRATPSAGERGQRRAPHVCSDAHWCLDPSTLHTACAAMQLFPTRGHAHSLCAALFKSWLVNRLVNRLDKIGSIAFGIAISMKHSGQSTPVCQVTLFCARSSHVPACVQAQSPGRPPMTSIWRDARSWRSF